MATPKAFSRSILLKRVKGVFYLHEDNDTYEVLRISIKNISSTIQHITLFAELGGVVGEDSATNYTIAAGDFHRIDWGVFLQENDKLWAAASEADKLRIRIDLKEVD